jgi:hypothetical protein
LKDEFQENNPECCKYSEKRPFPFDYLREIDIERPSKRYMEWAEEDRFAAEKAGCVPVGNTDDVTKNKGD